jgi:predicted DNA-binding transcriptional regulator YafY
MTAAELQKQLANNGIERDIRTIQRHLDTLSEHFKLERDDRDKPYGYSWLKYADGISVPGLTAQESLLLALAEQNLQALLPVKLMKSMEGLFSQSHRILGPGTSAKLERQWLRKVRVVAAAQPLLPPKIKSGVLEEVSTALYENRVLEVDYQNASSKRQKTRVWPLGLAQQGPRLYLVCRFEGYDNERSLAMHRFNKAQALIERFSYPADFDLEKFDDDGRFGFGDSEKIRLKFKITKNAGLHLTESPLSNDQQIIEYDDHYDITATVVDTAMLTWWLRGFGEAVWGIEKSQD